MAYVAIPPRDISWYGDPRKHAARCDLCPLKGNTFVPYAPPAPGKKLRLVVVGEGPGRKEEILKTPFVGLTGERLNEEIEAVGLNREEMHVTNATLCVGFDDKENERAVECCAPRLLRELAVLPADVPILAMGKAAAKSVLGVKSILLARGFVWTAREISTSIDSADAAVRKAEREFAAARGDKKVRAKKAIVEAKLRRETLFWRNKLAGRTIFPALHPTFAFIHNETWAPIFRIDIDRCARFVRRELRLEDLADRIERVKTLKEFKARKRVFVVTDSASEILKAGKALAGTVSVDIETESTQPLSPLTVKILSVQIADVDRAIVIGPWDAKLHAKALTELLSPRTIVFHNGFNFDQPALERPGEDVVIDPKKVEDTLVAHHAFASQYPQRLDHVVSTFVDSGPWKIKFGRRGAEEKGLPPQNMDPEELYHYGAVDPILTIRSWHAMQADLESERAVYEHDKQLGIQGKLLQVDGIQVDVARKEELSKALARRAAYLKGHMRKLARKPHFSPSKLGEVRQVLFGTLRAPMLNPTSTGLASTSNATLEVIRTAGAGTLRKGPGDVKRTKGPVANKTQVTRAAQFAESLLNWRVAQKIKSTYLDAVQVHADGRAHYNWRPYGTNSGRYSCRLQSAPRWSKKIEDRVREIYVPRENCSFVYFDLSQAEMRMGAALSGDPVFMATCAGDVHTGNAKILFGDQPEALERLTRDPKGKDCPQHAEDATGGACTCGKPFRDIAKNAGFAVSYLADASTVFAYLRAHGFPVDADSVETMIGSLKAAYSRYYEYVAENVRFVERNGYLRTAILGRIRWFGYHPKPTEIANCLDEETEALTQRGWVRGFDLRPGDKLLTKNKDSGMLEWRPMARLCLFPDYTGPLVEFKSKSFNAVTTPEHRWLVRDRKAGRDVCTTTSELAADPGAAAIHLAERDAFVSIDQVQHIPAGERRPVWCPVVPNTFFVARRRGDVFVTGNTPIQSGIADAMNIAALHFQRTFPRSVRLVAQIHDANIWEVPNELIAWKVGAKGKKYPAGPIVEEIERYWTKPVHLPVGVVCREARDVMLPCEVKVADRWSAFG